MGKQHNNFSKDRDLLAEAYGAIFGGQHTFQDTGTADQAASYMAAEEDDEHNKTGDESDAALIKKYTYKDDNGELHLTDAGRDALSKAEEEEDTDEADQKHFKQYDTEVTDEAEGQGFRQ